MRGIKKNRMKRDRHTDIHTYNGHRNFMIESAQWADSMKIYNDCLPMPREKFDDLDITQGMQAISQT